MPFTHARKVVDRSLFTSLLFDEIAVFLGENSRLDVLPDRAQLGVESALAVASRSQFA